MEMDDSGTGTAYGTGAAVVIASLGSFLGIKLLIDRKMKSVRGRGRRGPSRKPTDVKSSSSDSDNLPDASSPSDKSPPMST